MYPRAAWKYTARLVQEQLPPSARPTQAQLQPILTRNAPRHPIHPTAFLKQSKGRWYSTHGTIGATVRRFTTSAARLTGSGVKYDRSAFPKSRIGSAVINSTGRAPFASTLRPNLTGGTLNRTAGGYAWGSGRAGSARYFSHGPAAPAQVVHNVSQAVRAFMISGKKAHYDGVNPRSGEKRYKAVSALEDQVSRTMNKVPKATPGSTINFNINPTVTALTTLKPMKAYPAFANGRDTLNQDGLLDMLSVDFSRAVKELAAVLGDLQRLSSLGDLPITYDESTLKVHFPGCDWGSVDRLCNELGIRRGVVQQDEDFDAFVGTEIALLFPFAPSRTPSECSFFDRDVSARQQVNPIDWENMLSSREILTPEDYSTHSEDGFEFEVIEENPWVSFPSGYDSVHSSEVGQPLPLEDMRDSHTPLEYQGIEGIYRFLEQCESAQQRSRAHRF